MTRRVLGFLGATVVTLAAFAGPAQACDAPHHGEDWACVYVSDIDTGYCQQNPVPTVDAPEEARLLPELPSLYGQLQSMGL